jgi:hypothetical protein
MTARYLIVMLLAIVAGISTVAAQKFQSVWKAAEVSKLNFAGKKIAALVITDDQSLQMSGEEALARELNQRQVTGVPTYRILPREEMKSADTARPWFERAGVQGVVAIRPVRHEITESSSPVVWSTYTNDFWGYYGYGWTGGVSLSRSREEGIIVETLVFTLTPDRLVWAATSETKNPKSLQAFITDLVGGVVQEMRKMKLVRQP